MADQPVPAGLTDQRRRVTGAAATAIRISRTTPPDWEDADVRANGSSIFFAATILLAAAITLTAATGRAQSAAPTTDQLAFEVLRKGKPIGSHTISFTPNGDALQVDIDIRLDVKFLMFNAYSYRHSNREVWRDGRLVEISTKTDDDGEAFFVNGRANGEGFEISASSGSTIAPENIIPTSYWDPAIVRQSQLLNTQNGELLDVTVEPGDETEIEIGDGTVNARHYVMSGDLDLELWYDPAGTLARLRFEASDGSTIDYRAQHPVRQ